MYLYYHVFACLCRNCFLFCKIMTCFSKLLQRVVQLRYGQHITKKHKRIYRFPYHLADTSAYTHAPDTGVCISRRIHGGPCFQFLVYALGKRTGRNAFDIESCITHQRYRRTGHKKRSKAARTDLRITDHLIPPGTILPDPCHRFAVLIC